jgi:hypothetical protein
MRENDLCGNDRSRFHFTRFVTDEPSQKKMKTAKYTDAEALFVEQFLQKQAVNLLYVLGKICVVFST